MNEEQYKSIFEMAQEIAGNKIVQSPVELFKPFADAIEKYINIKINDLRNEFRNNLYYKEKMNILGILNEKTKLD